MTREREEELLAQIDRLQEDLEDAEYEADSYRRECDDLERNIETLNSEVEDLENACEEWEYEYVTIKDKYVPENILWTYVYDLLLENRNNLDPVKVEEVLKQMLQ